jgi:hypothetical protein
MVADLRPSEQPTRGCLRYARGVNLLTELDAFSTEHRRCGDLEAGVEGDDVCGASIARRVDEADDGLA